MVWTVLLLVGCPWVGSGTLEAVRDADGDGVLGCAFVAGDRACDCDDDDATVGAGVESDWFADADGDGFGNDVIVRACVPPDLHVAVSGDCDDGRADQFPGAVEKCNDLDDDCDGQIDEEPGEGTQNCFADLDGDGAGSGSVVATTCGECPDGSSLTSNDCNDEDATRHPGTAWFTDRDGDDVGSALVAVQCDDVPDAITVGGDCDDDAEDVFPGAPDEPYDGIDSDCGGGTDLDVDGDGDPDLLPLPSEPGAPLWGPDITPLNGCDGDITEVRGASGQLQLNVEQAAPDDVLWVHPSDDGAYGAVVVDKPLCFVAEAGVVIEADGDTPAFDLVSSGHVLIEGFDVQADHAVTVGSGNLHVVLSRVVHVGGTATLHERSATSGRLDLLHVEVIAGQKVGSSTGHVVVRGGLWRSLATTDVLLAVVDGDLDLHGLHGEGLYTQGMLSAAPLGAVHLEAMRVEGLVGPIIDHGFGSKQPPPFTMRSIWVRDATAEGSLIRVDGVADADENGRFSGDATLEQLDIRSTVPRPLTEDYSAPAETTPAAAVVVTGLANVTLAHSVIINEGAQAVTLNTSDAVMAHLALASDSVALSTTSGSITHSTLAAPSTCAENPEFVNAQPIPVSDVYFVGCNDNVGIDEDPIPGNGDVFSTDQAMADLLHYHPNLPVELYDLRPHPTRAPELVGTWAPGFVDDQLDPGPSPSFVGAFTHDSPLVAQLHDEDGNGMYDTWEQAHGIWQAPAASDFDADGLTNEAEFAGHPVVGQSSFPDVFDSDLDTCPDGIDLAPLDEDNGEDCN